MHPLDDGMTQSNDAPTLGFEREKRVKADHIDHFDAMDAQSPGDTFDDRLGQRATSGKTRVPLCSDYALQT